MYMILCRLNNVSEGPESGGNLKVTQNSVFSYVLLTVRHNTFYPLKIYGSVFAIGITSWFPHFKTLSRILF